MPPPATDGAPPSSPPARWACCWLIVWLLFPYNRLRRGSTQTQVNLEADFASQTKYGGNIPLSGFCCSARGTYAFAIGKGLTDGVWWFYLFYLPQFLNRNYGLDLKHAYWYIVTVYVISTIGSIFGGSLSGVLMKRGYSINSGRKLAMLFMAVLVLPLVLVPHMGVLFPANPWPATLIIALATAAHQGWSANLFSTPGDMFPPPPSPPSSASAEPPERLAEPASPGSSSATSRSIRCSSSPWPLRPTWFRSPSSSSSSRAWAPRTTWKAKRRRPRGTRRRSSGESRVALSAPGRRNSGSTRTCITRDRKP